MPNDGALEKVPDAPDDAPRCDLAGDHGVFKGA